MQPQNMRMICRHNICIFLKNFESFDYTWVHNAIEESENRGEGNAIALGRTPIVNVKINFHMCISW
jgi:hypothetical protein